MGENEQGGMLRTVVIVGLVAIIAGVMLISIVGLRGQMDKTSKQTTNTVQNAIFSSNADAGTPANNANLPTITN